ncbi:hypothetical protein [Halobellus sp. EA9]|uniref:hypothetical protein n=1 Tax=Halobellus sp. EA9 TaxID=3421647 RepID=UPI003EBABBA7
MVKTERTPITAIQQGTYLASLEHDPETVEDINESIPRHEGNLSALLTRMLWRAADDENHQKSVADVGVLVCDTLEAIPDFEENSDEHAMCRASAMETQGDPAVLTWAQGQDWLVL